MVFRLLLSFFILLSLLSGCQKTSDTLMESLKPGVTGVDFNNQILETDSFNILLDEYIYNGGGVGVGDFDNDGLEDLYFAGNIVPNRLYLNKGHFKFEDVTEKAGVYAADIWSSGIAVVDINNDGWQDIYISATFKHEDGARKNKLYINQGLTDGVPVFVDKAHEYGIDDDGHSTQSVFFDYDLDGDLDLYILNNVFLGKRVMSNENAGLRNKSSTIDKLYRNDGNGSFTDISTEAGITLAGFGLGIAVLDINRDGYPDLYVSNDFVSSDVLYENNGDGTFSNTISRYFRHTSFASMGSDVSDINNDGLPEIMTLEMLPSDIQSMKMMYSTTVFNRDKLIMNAGYYKQFLRNCLQFNNGNGTFSDISYLLGISGTDWSWSALFADFDNDGYRDLAVANGFPRNVTDKDYADRLMKMVGLVSDPGLLLPFIPSYKSRNFFFKNLQGHRFENVSEQWGIREGSYSNGAAYVDLDNDGDLDYVTNNINRPAYIFRNNSQQHTPEGNWLRIKLYGSAGNRNGIGSKISLYTHGSIRYYEHYPCRGYISSVDPVIHFGLDTCTNIDSLRIIWPAGETQVMKHLFSNREISLEFNNATATGQHMQQAEPAPLFQDITESLHLTYRHRELDFLDYRIQPLLPHMHSREGPGLAVGDLNGDGLEDIVVGNGRHADIAILFQDKYGGFHETVLGDTADSEATGLLLFDADNDGDQDLYIVGGGSEFQAHSFHFRDRLFKNDGKGGLRYDPEALPDIFVSGSVVTAADYDRDGDLDLFVGGRMVPQAYPYSGRSIIYRNDGGRFTDVTGQICKKLLEPGMVTAALWTDYNQDGWADLLIAGEWMPVCFFRNDKGKAFIESGPGSGLEESDGWWNSISSGDFDQDGDLDYILGNQGLNNRYNPEPGSPLLVVARDFDNNGIVDPVISAWQNGNYFPVHLRNDLIQQMPFLKKKFPTYLNYSRLPSDSLFSDDEMKGALKMQAKIFESVLLMNRGDGAYSIVKLPFEAQFGPVKGILIRDYNFDHIPDLLITGNNYGSEALNGSHDALKGLFLKGNEHGDFQTEKGNGFLVDGDGRSLVELFDKQNNRLIFAASNDDSLRIFKVRTPDSRWVRFNPEPGDRQVNVYYKNGRVQCHEIYYGSSYLSQSSRAFLIDPSSIQKMIITDYRGNTREITGESGGYSFQE